MARSSALIALAVFCVSGSVVAQPANEPIELKPVAVSSSGPAIDIGSVSGVVNTIRGLARRGSERARLSRADNVVVDLLLAESARDSSGLTRQQIFIADRDLNGDGVVEIIVELVSPYYLAGGNGGFETRIYRLEGEPRRILLFNATTIATDCSSRSEGFCDIILDGEARVRYRAGVYAPTVRGSPGAH